MLEIKRALMLMCALSPWATAQTYLGKPTRMIVYLTPGSIFGGPDAAPLSIH